MIKRRIYLYKKLYRRRFIIEGKDHGLFKNRTGETKQNNHGTTMKIIAYRGNNDIDVEFQDEHHYVKNTTYSNFKRGNVKNPYDKDLFGVGYLGVGKYKCKRDNEENLSEVYETWMGMLRRCYFDNAKFPAYYNCIVCDEWHNFQNFAKWYDENKYPVNERLHIDKDILYPNCHMYSPKTCLLTPQRINMLFMNKPNSRGLPNGIFKIKNGYRAEYQGNKIGKYNTLDEAYDAYSIVKENNIKKLADEYKDIIPKKLYDALYAYKVDINNDKNYKVS